MSTTRPRADLEERLRVLGAHANEVLTLDRLTRDFVMFQRRRGHRFSTDDLLTAWYAIVNAPANVTSLLDLGTGIGSVGLTVLWAHPDASLTAIEVQDVSYALLTENVWANDVAVRVRTIHGDLREFVPAHAFELVTGSPPYFDPKSGIISADSQRAGARFELKGDVTDYCRAARRALAVGGRFVFCFPTVQRARAEAACAAADLPIVATCDVIPKEGLPALFSLYACRRAEDGMTDEGARLGGVTRAISVDTITVRDKNGAPTQEMLAARRVLGFEEE